MSHRIRSTRYDRSTLFASIVVIAGLVLAVTSSWSGGGG